jgi:hypothetical protein
MNRNRTKMRLCPNEVMLHASSYLIQTVPTSTYHTHELSKSSPVPLQGRVTVCFTDKD